MLPTILTPMLPTILTPMLPTILTPTRIHYATAAAWPTGVVFEDGPNADV